MTNAALCLIHVGVNSALASQYILVPANEFYCDVWVFLSNTTLIFYLQANKPSKPPSPKPPPRKTPHASLLAARAQRQMQSTAARFMQHSRLARATSGSDPESPLPSTSRITSVRRPPSNLPSRLAGFPAWSSQLFTLSPSQAARGVAEARVQDVEGGTPGNSPRADQAATNVVQSTLDQERTSLPGLVPSSRNSLSDRLSSLARSANGHEASPSVERTDSMSSISSVHPPMLVMQQMGGALVSGLACSSMIPRKTWAQGRVLCVCSTPQTCCRFTC